MCLCSCENSLQTILPTVKCEPAPFLGVGRCQHNTWSYSSAYLWTLVFIIHSSVTVPKRRLCVRKAKRWWRTREKVPKEASVETSRVHYQTVWVYVCSLGFLVELLFGQPVVRAHPEVEDRRMAQACVFVWRKHLNDSDGCLNLLNDLHRGLGRRKQGAFVLLPEATRTRVSICAQLIVLLFLVLIVLAGIFVAWFHVVQTQGVDAGILRAGRRRTVVHFGPWLLALLAFSLTCLGHLLVNLLSGRLGLQSLRLLLRWARYGRRRSLHVAHLSVDPFHNVVVDKQVGDDAKLGRLWAGRGFEVGGGPEEPLSQGDGQVHGLGVIWGHGRDWGAGKLADTGHRLVDIFT